MKKIILLIVCFLACMNLRAQSNECGSAPTLVSNTTCTNTAGSTAGFTNSSYSNCHIFSNEDDDGWFKFVAVGTSTTVTVDGNADMDPDLSVLSGTCASLTQLACVDGTGTGGIETATITTTIGSTYYIFINDYASGSGTFNICVTHAPPPPCGVGNPIPTNACSAAPLLTNINGFCGTTLGSYTPDGSFSGCADDYVLNNTSWLKFTAADDEVVINYWITGPGGCTDGIQLAVVTGTCGSTMTSVACATNPTGGIGSSGTFTMSPLTPGQTYYLMIDGYGGDVCDYVFSVESGVALSCATCDVPACATNSVVDDYYTLETEFINNDSWDAFGAIAATSTPLTSNGTAQGPITVCTDIPVTGLNFVGFDYLYNSVDVAPVGTDPDAVITLVGAYQELTTGACTALVSSSTNGYGGPQFNNTGGTPGTTAGAFDNTKPITVCYSYALDGTKNNGDILSGVTVMGYGCAAPTNITYVSQTACSSNLYTATLTITWDPTDLPSPAELGGTGNVSLVVNGQTFTLTSAEQAAGSKNITLTNLTADGNPVNVTTSFATSSVCTYSETAVFTAPVSCAASCVTPTPGITNNESPVSTVITCPNPGISVTATGGATYAWSGGSTPSTAANTFTSAGTYTVTVTAASGGTCTATTSITITGNTTAPIAGLSNNGPICSGATATLTATPATGATYLWSAGATAVAGTNTATATPATTTTYTVTVTDSANGCESNSTTSVTVQALPNAGTLSGLQNVCGTGTTTFASDGNTGGTWSSSNTAVATVNATTGVVTGVAAGTATITYSVAATSPCTTPATATRTVTVVAPPNAGTLSGTQNVCGTGTTTFTSNGDTGGTWSSSNTAVATVDASTGVVTGVAAGTATITYSVAATSPCTTPATATRTVTVVAPPNAGTLSGTQNVCGTGTTTFASNGDTGGTWSSSNTAVATVDASTGVVTGVAAGTATITYSVAATSPCATPATATRTVTVVAPPNAGTLSGAQNVCGTGTTTFTSNGDTGGTWSSSNTAVATVNASGDVTGVAAGTATITYSVAATSPCTTPATATRTVTVVATPSITSSGANLCSTGSRTLAATPSGGTFSVLSGPGSISGTTLTASGIGAIVVQYSVTVGGCTGTTTQTITTVACTRTITITDPCSCNNDATVSVNGTPALPVTNGTFDEVIGLNGLLLGDVITVNSITGLQSVPGTPYTPATAAAAFVVAIPAATLSGVHTDNVGYTISVHISNTVPGSEFEGDLVISNKCAYPNPNFSIASFGDCNTARALTTVHSAEGNGTAAYSGPGVSGTNFTPTGLTGAQTITLTYTGINDGNNGISPDSGTTAVFPGCREVIQRTVTVNCPACQASPNMQWGN